LLIKKILFAIESERLIE